MRRILAGVVLALMLTGGAVQEPFQEAFVAWSKGDYASAFRLWRPLAAQGDAASQFYLATLYEQGRGVPQDYAEAEKVDFDRGAPRHLAFGFGQHICLGMHLAKLELITAIECWLTNLPAFRLAQDFSPSWHGGISLGLDVLELEW